jgi:hypothetical protein
MKEDTKGYKGSLAFTLKDCSCYYSYAQSHSTEFLMVKS